MALDIHLSDEAVAIVRTALGHELDEATANVGGSLYEPLAIREVLDALGGRLPHKIGDPVRPYPATSEPASRHGNVEEPTDDVSASAEVTSTDRVTTLENALLAILPRREAELLGRRIGRNERDLAGRLAGRA